MEKITNMELRDEDLMAASGGKKIIAGLDEKQIVDVASRVLEMSGISPTVKGVAENVKKPFEKDNSRDESAKA